MGHYLASWSLCLGLQGSRPKPSPSAQVWTWAAQGAGYSFQRYPLQHWSGTEQQDKHCSLLRTGWSSPPSPQAQEAQATTCTLVPHGCWISSSVRWASGLLPATHSDSALGPLVSAWTEMGAAGPQLPREIDRHTPPALRGHKHTPNGQSLLLGAICSSPPKAGPSLYFSPFFPQWGWSEASSDSAAAQWFCTVLTLELRLSQAGLRALLSVDLPVDYLLLRRVLASPFPAAGLRGVTAGCLYKTYRKIPSLWYLPPTIGVQSTNKIRRYWWWQGTATSQSLQWQQVPHSERKPDQKV